MPWQMVRASRSTWVLGSALLAFALLLVLPTRSQATAWWERAEAAGEEYVRIAAAERGGEFSFAFTDRRGRIHGYRAREPRFSASAVKAMLLVAFLRRADVRDRDLTPAEQWDLHRMIAASANDPALALYQEIGDHGLARLAWAARMRHFEGGGANGWGAVAASASDWVRFYTRLRRLLPPRHRAFAMEQLRSIVPEQSWGIPVAATAGGWTSYFKGGWVPTETGWVMVQNARLEHANETMAISILSEGRPSYGVGAWDIQLTAWEILSEHPRHRP
jgi:hypothetical protein